MDCCTHDLQVTDYSSARGAAEVTVRRGKVCRELSPHCQGFERLSPFLLPHSQVFVFHLLSFYEKSFTMLRPRERACLLQALEKSDWSLSYYRSKRGQQSVLRGVF